MFLITDFLLKIMGRNIVNSEIVKSMYSEVPYCSSFMKHIRDNARRHETELIRKKYDMFQGIMYKNL